MLEATPDQLGPYRILAPIGQGSHSVVFRALNVRLDREGSLSKYLALGPCPIASGREWSVVYF